MFPFAEAHHRSICRILLSLWVVPAPHVTPLAPEEGSGGIHHVTAPTNQDLKFQHPHKQKQEIIFWMALPFTSGFVAICDDPHT